jgi:hypothetical protein
MTYWSRHEGQSEGECSMEIRHPNTAPSGRALTGGGVRQINGPPRSQFILGVGGAGTPNAFRLSYGEGAEGGEVLSPRHRHTFDQFRFFMGGAFTLADYTIPVGYVGYFPESVFYGPQVIDASVKVFSVQFGGASGIGYITPAERPEGMARLRERGSFEGGLFVTVDENGERHNQDGFEALQEEIRGKKVDYAPPRYSGQVLMDPENFAWSKDPDNPGVAVKLLGRFTERDARVGFVRIDAGASYTFGHEQAPEILFLHTGVISYAGASHPRLTAFSVGADEGPYTLVASETAELLYMKLPTF